MSEKIPKSWSNLGEIDTNSNRVQRDARGAIEMTNMGDLAGDGSVELLPGYSPVSSAPMLTAYTTGTVTVTNGSKDVVGSSTRFVDGPVVDIVTNGNFTDETVPPNNPG